MSPNDPGPAGDPTHAFRALAEIVYGRPSYQDVYDAICVTAVQVVPGCDHACVTSLRAGGELVTEGASDEIAATIDQFEKESGQGPCLDAILNEDYYQHDPDIAASSAWPDMTKLVLKHTPVRGMLGYRLLGGGGRKVGALNLFSDTAGALTRESADLGAIMASFASVALSGSAHHERAESLQRGLESNREIGKAVGLIMATYKISDDEAFDVLRKASSELNLKLAEVARRVIDDQRTTNG